MKGLQGFAYQANNLLLLETAAITAEVAASAKAPLVYPLTKEGNGNIAISGAFTGADDARYEVAIEDTDFDEAAISVPVFGGVGSGKISDIEVTGLEAQKIQLRCTGIGVATATAQIELEDVIFRAKTPGVVDITMSIDDSELVFTDSGFSTVKDLKAGENGIAGQELDWETSPLQAGLIPVEAHRVAFGEDRLNIYLQYKTAGKYYFIPELKADIPAGTKVYFVTEGRTVTVTDGVTPEEYTDIISIADLWSGIKATSLLLEPADLALDISRGINSYAVREFTQKTRAYFLPPYKKDGSSKYAGELSSILVSDLQTTTELLEIKCVDNAYVGSEIWEVRGSSSGALGQGKTGDFNNYGPVGFTIPQKLPPDFSAPKEDWSYETDMMSRGVGVDPPPVCFSMRLGINAQPQTLTLEYKKKPTACSCPPVKFGDACLGFEERGGEIGMPFIIPDLRFWLDATLEAYIESYYSGDETAESAGRIAMAPYQLRFSQVAERIMALPEPTEAGTQKTALEALITDFKALIATIALTEPFTDLTYTTALYTALVDDILAYECAYGLKKNSVITPGSCYVDSDAEYYWEVRGSKAYARAYTDIPYYSTIKSGDSYVNTKEFAFNISIPCGGTLLEGDKLTIIIGGIKFENTYLVGDVIYLPTIAAQDLLLLGGVDGDDSDTWEITGSQTFDPYICDRDNPLPYAESANLSFLITPGARPFAIGDTFEFNIESGHFKWRKDGGAWSSLLPISQTSQALDSGLSILFTLGVNPSFLASDSWEILCLQENRVANMSDIDSEQYKGTGSVVFALTEETEIDTLIIDNYAISGDLSFQASNNADFSGDLIHDELIEAAGRLPLICKLYLDAPISATYFRLVPATPETAVTIGYIFIGSLMRLSEDTDNIKPSRQYMMNRVEGKKALSLLDYVKTGYTLSYNSFLKPADFALLDALVEWSKGNNDEPFYFIPNTNYPATCMKGSLDADNIDMDYVIDINMPTDDRRYTLTLPIIGTR